MLDCLSNCIYYKYNLQPICRHLQKQYCIFMLKTEENIHRFSPPEIRFEQM